MHKLYVSGLLSLALVVPAFGEENTAPSTAALAPAPLVITGKAAELIVTHIQWKSQEKNEGVLEHSSFYDFKKTTYTIARSWSAWIGIYNDLTCFQIENFYLQSAGANAGDLFRTDYSCFVGPERRGDEPKFRFSEDKKTVTIHTDYLDTLWNRLNHTEDGRGSFDYDKARNASFDWGAVKGETVEGRQLHARDAIVTIHLDR